jgi:predicted aspartyl protease
MSALRLAGEPVMAAKGACQLVKIGELSVTTTHHEPLAAVSIDGHAAQMLVDTGAAKSTLWRPALESLGLHAVGSGARFIGVNGADEADIFTVRDFALGGYVVHDIRMYVTGRGARAFAGLLGEDFLSKLDVEFDLQSQTIRLFTPKDCPGDEVVYWAKAYSMVALVHPVGSGHWPLVKVLLNGREVVAILDSGAMVSGVTSDLVRRPGMAPESASTPGQPVVGIAGQPLASSVAVFRTLTVGEEQIQNVKLRVADLFKKNREPQTGSLIPASPMFEPDLILGADFFLAHRIYIAHSQGKVYFTYQGGPIFQTQPQEPAAPGN